MGLAPPAGEYVEEMLTPDGWPEFDEDINFDRAEHYMQVLRQVSDVADNCRRQRLATFDGDVWMGSAAGAANREVGMLIDALTTMQNGLAAVITWHRNTAVAIIQAKSDIYDNVEVAQNKIKALANEFRLTDAERSKAIAEVITETHGANAGVVTGTAEQILASKSWKPPADALQDLLDQRAAPTPAEEEPSDSEPVIPGPVALPRPGPVASPPPGPVAPPPVGLAKPQSSLAGIPAPKIRGWSPAAPTAAAAGVPGRATPGAGATTPGPARRPAVPERDGSDTGPAGPVLPDAASYGGGPQDDSPRVAPASASVMPAVPMAPGAAGGGAGGSAQGAGPAGGGAPGLGGPAGRVSPGQSSAVRPAAATRRPAPRGDRVASRDSNDAAQVVEVTAMASIPVSPARLERDAMAEAATADAARRRGADPLLLARRIAAALNAPVGEESGYFGFFWVTGVTTDGAIVVANSYGLAYIPDGVQLPEQVSMATADEAIPVAERSRWATYPVLAVQGWAAHRNATLRAVIGTAEQLAACDPGAAKVVLAADDIPDSGEMTGRSRLEVVNAEAAERLAQTPDGRLCDVLGSAAGSDPPADERFGKWIEVMKPMVHDDPARQAPHLKAFNAYAAHARDVAVHDAYCAADAGAQRRAVQDWLYWKHLAELLGAALSVAS